MVDMIRDLINSALVEQHDITDTLGSPQIKSLDTKRCGFFLMAARRKCKK